MPGHCPGKPGMLKSANQPKFNMFKQTLQTFFFIGPYIIPILGGSRAESEGSHD